MKIKDIINTARVKAMFLEPDNSAPLMTHDITEDGCNGLADCKIHKSLTPS